MPCNNAGDGVFITLIVKIFFLVGRTWNWSKLDLPFKILDLLLGKPHMLMMTMLTRNKTVLNSSTSEKRIRGTVECGFEPRSGLLYSNG